ncbi:MAG: hypothetical protein K0U79_06925 [Gammaproteobacteria bacterium]|nr:hypothetical protein [Gammaproteobacteria bacterium]
MSKPLSRIAAAIALTLGLFASSALAQSWPSGPMIDANANVNTMILNQQVQADIMAAHQVRQASKAAAEGSTTSVSTGSDFSYRPKASISEAMEQKFLANLRAIDESMALSAETDLQDRDMIERFEADVGPYGLELNDVADAMTAYWVVSWMAANQEDLPEKSEVQAARTQVRTQLAGNAAFASADNDERQQLAETYIYETMWTITLRSSAKSDAEREQIAAAAQAQARKQGLDLRGMQLTSRGFVRG